MNHSFWIIQNTRDTNHRQQTKIDILWSHHEKVKTGILHNSGYKSCKTDKGMQGKNAQTVLYCCTERLQHIKWYMVLERTGCTEAWMPNQLVRHLMTMTWNPDNYKCLAKFVFNISWNHLACNELTGEIVQIFYTIIFRKYKKYVFGKDEYLQ